MEAAIATVAMLLVILGALAVLAENWPHSYRRGGFGLSRGRGRQPATGDHDGADERDTEAGLSAHEDDDFRWPWREPDDR